MTREQKLALIVGFALVLVVGVLISDQLSAARRSVDPTEGAATTLTAALEPSGDLGPAFGREFEHREQINPRPRPADDTIFVLTNGSEGIGATPESTTLAEQASSALGAMGNLIVDAQNGLDPAMADVPMFDMGQKYENPVPPTESRLGGESDEIESRDSSHDEEARDLGVRPVRTHRVQEDETLWSIAKRYYGDGNLATALATHNASRIGKGNVIHVGSSLLIPDAEVLGGSSKAKATASKVASSEKTAPTTKKPSEKTAKKPEPTKTSKGSIPKTYTVKSGDTLQKISEKYFGTTKRWNDILELNSTVIDDEDGLQVGTVIKLPQR